MTSGIIFHLRPDIRDSVIVTLQNMCKNKESLVYDKLKEGLPLRISGKNWQDTDKFYYSTFWYEVEQELFQYDADAIISKKSEELSILIFKQNANYGIVMPSLYSRNFLTLLNNQIAKKLKSDKSPFQWVNLKLNNEYIDKLRKEKQISNIVLLYSRKTQDTV